MKKESFITYSILGIILLFFVGKKIKKVMDYKREFVDGLNYLKNNYNLTYPEAVRLEQQYRLETAHFKSGQFKGTLSPGMEKFSDKYPYGWSSLKEYFWDDNQQHRPYGFYPYTEGGTGKKKYFLKFNNLKSAMATVLANARMKGGKFEAWYSNNPDSQARYLKTLKSITPKLVGNVF